jgi:putative ABC transport system permease protein
VRQRLAATRLGAYLAVRNLRRQLRRSLSALLTIGGGVAALLLAEGYSAGMFGEFRDATIRAEYGHLQLTRPGFHELGRSNLEAYRIGGLPPALAEALLPGTVQAPRFLLNGLVSAGDITLPFSGRGIDPAVDAQGGRALRVADGDRLAASDDEAVLLGAGLARQLRVSAGDRIVLLVSTADEQLNAREATVRGVVASSSSAVGDALIIMPLRFARTLMRSEGSHQVLLFLPEDVPVAEATEILSQKAAAADLELRDWLSLAEFYRRAEALFRQQLTVVLVIVMVILLLSIGNTQMMAVLERTREIGTVMALGARSGRVMRGFLLEGALLGIIGVGAGIAAAYALAALLDILQVAMAPPPGFSVGYTARIDLSLEVLLRVALLSWGATVAASVYPAWRASRLQIVDALRVVR